MCGTRRGAGGAPNEYTTIANQTQSILSPKTQDDYILRAEFIANVSENSVERYEVYTQRWEKNGKDRTYIKMDKIRQSDGKSKGLPYEMGYYDNVSNTYYPGRGKNENLSGSVWNMSGSKKYGEEEIATELKKRLTR